MEELILKIENAGSAAGAGANGKDGKPEEQPKSFFDKMKGSVQGGLKSAGIQFGVSSLLKQSQLFTSFAGSIFQIVGGMIDLMLAPLMPIFIPVLKFLAKMMPGVRKTAGAIANFIIMVGSAIGSWWKENAPSWLQGGDGTALAQVLGGVLTVLLFSKFTGIWKFATWCLKLKVGQTAAGEVAKVAAKEAGKKGAKTIGQHIKGQIWRFIKWLGSGFKALMYKIPGVKSLVTFVKKIGIQIKSFWNSIKTNFAKLGSKLKGFFSTVGTFLKNAIKNLASHLFKGNKQALRLMVKWLAAPFKVAGRFIWGLLKGPLNTLKGFGTKIWGWFKGPLKSLLNFFKGPISFVKGLFSKVWTFLKGPIATMGDFAQKWIGKAGKFADNAWVFLKGLPQMLLEKAGKVLEAVLKKPFEIIKKIADLPIFSGIKGMVKGLTGIFKSGGAVGKIIGAAKGTVGKGVAKIGGKAGLQAAGMSIPIFGSAIGLAAGIYETQRIGRKYGWNAKTIGAGLAYTAVQTGAGFVGGPAGIGAAIAGEVALMAYEHKVLKVEMGGPDEQTKVSMQNEQGRVSATAMTNQALDYQIP